MQEAKRGALLAPMGLSAFVAFILVMLIACKQGGRESSSVTNSDAQHRTMSLGRLSKLRTGVTNIRLGDTVDDVKSTIGDPDADYLVLPKRQNTRWTKVRIFDYYISLVSQTPGNIDDKIVSLEFDQHSRLFLIRSNVDGIQSICCGAKR